MFDVITDYGTCSHYNFPENSKLASVSYVQTVYLIPHGACAENDEA